ncbi:hypothetical protein [Loigolactobacillus zhaoyuanensis]|uniref:DUF4868 domain-containing protein n=1 Tax=Loigolactobacillus zhaoyuanensis TaxID=2486017 RepID=A0ABW8U8U5_9LACO
MTPHEAIRQSLESIRTDFWELDPKTKQPVRELKLHEFASFLACERPLPLNATILRDFAGQAIKPKALGEKYQPDFDFSSTFFTDDQPFNNQYMFVGLNVAARTGAADTREWWNFHDKKLPTNTFKLYLELNQDERYRGCYITDVIKNTVDSDSANVGQNFFFTKSKKLSFIQPVSDQQRAAKLFEWDKNAAATALATDQPYERLYASMADALQEVVTNHEVFNKSARLFVAECKAINPEKIIVFGDTAKEALTQMLATTAFDNEPAVRKLVENCAEIRHYAYRKNFNAWITEYAPKAITDVEDTVIIDQ